MANIVHHISGEADEDTMSAWSSLAGGGGGGAGSPIELGTAPSLRRRGSFGMQMASCSEDPPFDFRNDKISLDEELANVGRGGDESEDVVTSFGGVVERAKDVALKNEGGGRGEVERAAILTAPGKSSSAQATLKPTVVAAGPSASETLENTDEHQNPSEAKDLSSISSPTDAGSPREEDGELPTGLVSGGEDTNDLHPPRRRSNQDDQSDGSNSKLNSARAEEGRNDVMVVSKQASSVDGENDVMVVSKQASSVDGKNDVMVVPKQASSVDGESVLGEEAEGPGEGNDFIKTAFSPQASIDSGVLDSRYVCNATKRSCDKHVRCLLRREGFLQTGNPGGAVVMAVNHRKIGLRTLVLGFFKSFGARGRRKTSHACLSSTMVGLFSRRDSHVGGGGFYDQRKFFMHCMGERPCYDTYGKTLLATMHYSASQYMLHHSQ